MATTDPSAGAQRTAQVEVHLQSASPLPPASELAAYEAIEVGLARELITMAQREHAHRIESERSFLRFQQWRSWLGLAAGWTVAIFGLLVGAFVAVEGNAVAGTIIASVDLIGLAGVFIYERQRVD